MEKLIDSWRDGTINFPLFNLCVEEMEEEMIYVTSEGLGDKKPFFN